MFQENALHLQSGLFSPESEMNRTRKSVLKNSWASVFYEKIFRRVHEKDFEGLYCSDNGRPNFPVNILVGLEVIKEMFSLTDEQLHENYHFNYLYQKALGAEDINKYSFHIRTLYNFRHALAEYERRTDKDLFAPLFRDGRDQIISELGIKTGLQRTDSVMISANIKRMSRFTLFHKVLSNLVRLLSRREKPVSDEVNSLVSDEEDGMYYRLTKQQAEETLKKLADFLFIHVKRWKTDEEICDTKEYKDAERLLSEQCIEVNETKITLKTPDEIPGGSLQNPADPDATHRNKRDEDFFGYSVHGTETCSPENSIQVITSVGTVRNTVDDAEVLAAAVPLLKTETGLETAVADGGFVSDEVRAACINNDIIFIATALRGRQLSEDALDSTAFTLKEDGLIDKCPNGEIPVKQKLKKDGTLTAKFDAQKCSACPLKDRCIAFSSEKKSVIKIDTKRRWIDERRAALKTDEYQTLCRMRPPVEGLMEKLKPKYLRGRTLFRGLAKVRNRMTLRAMGLNFRRYMAWILSFLRFFTLLMRPVSLRAIL